MCKCSTALMINTENTFSTFIFFIFTEFYLLKLAGSTKFRHYNNCCCKAKDGKYAYKHTLRSSIVDFSCSFSFINLAISSALDCRKNCMLLGTMNIKEMGMLQPNDTWDQDLLNVSTVLMSMQQL